MEKLPMCRICLVEDVRMYVVINKEMHELYEKLSNNPFTTTDHRPMLACSFCCTKLKQCCRFQRQCLQAEELFGLMLNVDHERNPTVNPDYLEFFSGFIRTPVHQISIVDENHNISDADDVKEELLDVCELDDIIQLKGECRSDDYNEVEPEDLDNSLINVEYKPKLQFETDSDDDVIFVGSQIEVEENLEVSMNKRRADTKRAPVAKKSKPQLQRLKQEDVTPEEHKKYEQSESKLKESPTYIKHEVTSSSSDTNTTSDTSSSNNSDNDDENKYKKQTVKEKRFKCDICHRGFYQKGHLNRHILVHTGTKRFECGICQCNFTRACLLFRHMASHTGEKPFKCDVCKRRFSQKNNLKRHSLIHTGEKPYKCDVCQYSCNQKADLKKHIRIHTDEKPYKCDLCEHSCNQKGTLTAHIISKHITSKKTLKSKKCQSFESKRNQS